MIEAIMNDLREIWLEFGMVNIYFLAAVMFVFFLVQTMLYAFGRGVFTQKHPGKTSAWLALNILYIAFVVDLTLLNREAGSRFDVSLQWFGTFHPDTESMRYVIENVLLFVPFGICVPNAIKWFQKWWKIGGAALITTLIIEITQWITKRGYFQLDDIWLNTVGALVGYIIYYLTVHAMRKCVIARYAKHTD